MNENLKERLAWQEERGGFKGGRERERFESENNPIKMAILQRQVINKTVVVYT